ncbi:MAG: hypothetical protein PT958_08345 [Firmicutes bacterium]|nr:hypothetical protein [Bacillota bacterium]
MKQYFYVGGFQHLAHGHNFLIDHKRRPDSRNRNRKKAPSFLLSFSFQS